MSNHRRRFGGLAAVAGAMFSLLGSTAIGQAKAGDPGDQGGPVAIAGPTTTIGAKTEAPAAPGSRIRLRLDQAVKPGSHYLWVQTLGPPINLVERTGPELKVTVPPGGDALRFLLVVADDQGIRSSEVYVPILPPSGPDAATSGTTGRAATAPTADAGDDQIGLVGHRITLNGSGSRPRSGLAYRWIQLGGPEVGSPVDAGSFFSFVPSATGFYRFALVVAQQNQISLPAYVNVTVGMPPAMAASTAIPPARLMPAGPLPPLSPMAAPAVDELDALVTAAVNSLEGGPDLAVPLAEVFETSAFRMDLYQTYTDVYVELSRRLDAILPPDKDPARRARWGAAFFEPLTRILITRMLPMGVDLRSHDGQRATLTDAQKRELRNQFDRTAKLLRSTRAPR